MEISTLAGMRHYTELQLLNKPAFLSILSKHSYERWCEKTNNYYVLFHSNCCFFLFFSCTELFFLIKGISTNQIPSEHVREAAATAAWDACSYQAMITRSYKVMWQRQVSLTDIRDCDQFCRLVFLCSSNSQSFACFHIIFKYRSI